MMYTKEMKFEYRSNGDLKSLKFPIKFLHSGSGKECHFGEKSHYDVVDFRNAWRDKIGLHTEGRWNPGTQGIYESMELYEMRAEVYHNGVLMGEKIADFSDVERSICLWLPPSNSKNYARENHEHIGTIFGLGVHNSLTRSGFKVELISRINSSDYFFELFSSEVSLIFVDETLMDGKTVASSVMQLAKVCTDFNISPPQFTVCVDFRKAHKVDQNLIFPNRTDYGYTSRKTRDDPPQFLDWSKLISELNDIIGI